jgi:peptidoglycan/LPS O-acetylase OafA/YrhL
MESEASPVENVIRPPFINYIEGMRGFLGLFVVLAHFRFLLDRPDYMNGPTATLIPGKLMWLAYCGSLVTVFIVISGFVLTIPVVLRGSMGGFWKFMQRRARRMIPPYYAAIALAVPLYVWELNLEGQHASIKGVASQVVTHLLFIHNLSWNTLEGLDGAMWSIAIEWQAYIVFALCLLPIALRFGTIASIVVGLAVGLVPTLLAATGHHVSYGLLFAHFWYFGIFAIGSAAAFVAFGKRGYERLQNATVWKCIAAACVIWYVAVIPHPVEQIMRSTIFNDLPVGIGVASWFIALAIEERSGKRGFFVRFFAFKPFIFLGTFSYTLYLVHQPIVTVVMLEAQRLAPAERIWVPVVAFPLIVAFAYGFARLFEFPFLSTYYRAGGEKALHANAAATQAAGAAEPVPARVAEA